jgi:hypothetical protein
MILVSGPAAFSAVMSPTVHAEHRRSALRRPGSLDGSARRALPGCRSAYPLGTCPQAWAFGRPRGLVRRPVVYKATMW